MHVALLGVFLEGSDESPRHGPSGLTVDGGILACLDVLATRPHDNVCAASLGASRLLVGIVSSGSFLKDANSGRKHRAHISTRVGGNGLEQALASFFGNIWLLEDTLGGVDVGEIESGSGMAGVEDCGQAHAGNKRLHQDSVHFVVNDMTSVSKIDGVDDLIRAIIFVAVQVFSLPAVAYIDCLSAPCQKGRVTQVCILLTGVVEE